MTLEILFEPRDVWIGIYWNKIYNGTTWNKDDTEMLHINICNVCYICLIPCFPVRIAWYSKKPVWFETTRAKRIAFKRL